MMIPKISRAFLSLAAGLGIGLAAQPGLAAPFSWTGAGGDNLWSNVNNWSPVGLPGAADDVTISAGAAAVTISTANVTVATLNLQRALTVGASRTLTVTTAALTAPITLASGATLTGTYNIGSGGNLVFPARCAFARLSNVTVNGDITAFTGGMRWNAVTLNGALSCSGSATAEVVFEGTQTVTGTIDASTSGTLILSSNANGTLTIAAGAKVQGGNIDFYKSSGCLGGATTYNIINNGTIDANIAGRTIDFNSASPVAITNNGAINVNGGTLSLYAFNGASGSVTINSGVINTTGTFNPIQFGTFTRNGGSTNIVGTADLAGGTWSPSGTWALTSGATVQNGTVNLASGNLAFPARCAFGRLSNLTVSGTIANFTGGMRWNNVTLNGTISTTGSATAEIAFEGTQTLTGTIAASTSGNLILSSNANGVLTIASSAKITGGNIDFNKTSPCLGGASSYSIINNGTIDANVAARSIDFNTSSPVAVTNNGTMTVSGGTLKLAGFTGAAGILNLDSGTLYVNGALNALGNFIRSGGGTGGTAIAYGTCDLGGGSWTPLGTWTLQGGASLENGTINMGGTSGIVFPARCGFARLSGITLNGDLPNFTGGMRWNNVTLNGTITTTGNATSEIAFEGSQTITGTLAASTTGNLILGSNANGTLTIAGGAKVIGGNIDFNRTSPCLGGATTFNVVNNGTIDANIAARTIDFTATSPVALTNNGTININGGTVDLGVFIGASGTLNLNSGSLLVTGAVNALGNFTRSGGGTGGTAIAYGTCDLGGGTWTPLGSWTLQGGASLENGIINMGGTSGIVFPARCGFARLSGITLNGDLPNFTGGMRWNNVTLNGTISTTSNGNPEIAFEGSQTLTGTISANTSGTFFLSGAANGTLTIAPGAKILGGNFDFQKSSGCLSGVTSYTLVNNGTIDANVSGRALNFVSSSSIGLTNNGVLAVGPGSATLFGITNNGTMLARAGGVFNLGNAAHTLASAGTLELEIKGPPPSTANFGRIVLPNNAAPSLALGGTLKVRNVAAYNPTCGLEWNFITSALVAAGTPITGTFSAFDLPFPGEGNLQRVVYEPKKVSFFIATQADFNEDGFITFEDFDEFVSAFEAGEGRSDFNADGFLTFEDFDAFVSKFEGGC